MLYVTFHNYKNDFDHYYDDARFNNLDELKEFLIKTAETRNKTPRHSKWWSSPVGVNRKDNRGWFRVHGTGECYSFWLKKVKTENGIIVFEENNYCSPKFMDFLENVKETIDKEPVYGDL